MDGSAKVSLILELKERIKSGLNKAKSYVNENVKEMKDKLNSLKTSTIETFQGMESQIPGLGSAIEMLANPYALVTAAVLALGVAYKDAVSKALDWEAKMAEINVTAQETRSGLSKISDQLDEIAGRNVTPYIQVADGFNRILSAGLTVKQSMEALEPTLKAAKAGFTDVETAASAGVSVMNASGESIKDVWDVIYATVNRGNANFKNVANYLPKVVANASAAGFSLREAAGAWAYLTGTLQPEQATTGLMNMFKQLASPTVTKNLKDIGVNIYDAQGNMKPFVAIIDLVKHKLDSLSARKRNNIVGGLGLDNESSMALNLLLKDTVKFKDIVKSTTNSTGQLDVSYKNAAQSTDSWHIIQNKVGIWFKNIGATALPIIDAIGNGILGVVQWFKDLYNQSALVRDTIAGLGIILKAAFYLALTPIKMIWNGLKVIYEYAKPFGEMLFGSIENAYRSMRPFLVYVYDLLKEIADIAYKFVTLDFSGAWKGIQNFKMPDIGDIKKRLEIEYQTDTKSKTDAFAGKKDDKSKPGKKDNKLEDDSVNKITDGSKQVHNITVNIDSIVKGGINTNNTQGLNGLSADDIQRFFENALMRTIANLETNHS